MGYNKKVMKNSLRHQMQIARRKLITKIKPSGKVYSRKSLKKQHKREE